MRWRRVAVGREGRSAGSAEALTGVRRVGRVGVLLLRRELLLLRLLLLLLVLLLLLRWCWLGSLRGRGRCGSLRE